MADPLSFIGACLVAGGGWRVLGWYFVYDWCRARIGLHLLPLALHPPPLSLSLSHSRPLFVQLIRRWEEEGQAKVTLKVMTDQEIDELMAAARAQGLTAMASKSQHCNMAPLVA